MQHWGGVASCIPGVRLTVLLMTALGEKASPWEHIILYYIKDYWASLIITRLLTRANSVSFWSACIRSKPPSITKVSSSPSLLPFSP